LKTRVHPGRIIVYAILFGIVLYLDYFLQSHFILILTFLFAALPVISLAALPVLIHYVSVSLSVPVPECETGAVSYVELGVRNRSFLLSLDIKIHFRAENAFYGTGQDMVFSFPVRIHDTYKQLIPMRLSRLGRVVYSVDSFRVTDLLGFVELHRKTKQSAEIMVLPSRGAVPGEVNESDLTLGMTESDETNKKGNDFSDVTDVREYIPGDKLMSIHWKLSAKRDILMVKDRSSMSDQQMLLLVDLAGKPAEVDEVLNLGYNVTAKLIESGTYVRLLWWSEGAGEFEERVIDHIANLKEAYKDMYHSTCYQDGEMLPGYLKNIRPELKAFVRIVYAEGKAKAQIISLD